MLHAVILKQTRQHVKSMQRSLIKYSSMQQILIRIADKFAKRHLLLLLLLLLRNSTLSNFIQCQVFSLSLQRAIAGRQRRNAKCSETNVMRFNSMVQFQILQSGTLNMLRHSQCCPVHHMLHVFMMLVYVDDVLFWGRTNATYEPADSNVALLIMCFFLLSFSKRMAIKLRRKSLIVFQY